MNKYDEIKIEGLSFTANHGVYDFETKNGQTFIVDAILYTDFKTCSKSDEISDAVNYGEICQFIYEYLTEHTFHLLETAAELVSMELLLSFPTLQGVKLELKKPEAPVDLKFDSISVVVERFRHTAFIAFGSNMGDRDKYIENGLAELAMNPFIELKKQSNVIVTKPYGYTEQGEFLNGVCEIKTILSPEELLHELHRIEKLAHRSREIHWGPRTLDLDIIYYDDLIMNTEDLIIPHVDMENRDFVLQPLCEIAPYFRHPIYHLTNAQLYKKLKK